MTGGQHRSNETGCMVELSNTDGAGIGCRPRELAASREADKDRFRANRCRECDRRGDG